ncbi:hypothetical protein EII29_01170 [Leptotrichia sp. OH3620_COT-345]|uniref:hypothetical protein n=1 Tax=Leptotrichia sp. OH3620_COT-345 TaxID=2491048 RepID=UPI000F65384D|nr:hypothetical protein [Leptotrichia sp. OH3620_COT-345]RRD41089.1 hypothetical protein EII29_01170 [Leptotrichia sp. OH3620_COT-345]
MNKKKLQMIEFPSISHTIKKYDNFQNEVIITVPRRVQKKIKRKTAIKVRGVNIAVVSLTMFYIFLLVSTMMIKMWMTYNVSNLGIEKTNIENKLNELKKEVETLENTYISNFDLKKVEEKSKQLGFIPNDDIKYVKINN